MLLKKGLLRGLLVALVCQVYGPFSPQGSWALPGGGEDGGKGGAGGGRKSSSASSMPNFQEKSLREQKERRQKELQEEFRRQARIFTTSPLLVERVRAADALSVTYPEVLDGLSLGFHLPPYKGPEALLARALSTLPPSPSPLRAKEGKEAQEKTQESSQDAPLSFSVVGKLFVWEPLPDVALRFRKDPRDVEGFLKKLPPHSPGGIALWQAWYQSLLNGYLGGIHGEVVSSWMLSYVRGILSHLPKELPMRQELCKSLGAEKSLPLDLRCEAILRLDEGDLKRGLLEEILVASGYFSKDLRIHALRSLPPGHKVREQQLISCVEARDVAAKWRVLAAEGLPETSELRRQALRDIVYGTQSSFLSKAAAAVLSKNVELKEFVARAIGAALTHEKKFGYKMLQSESLDEDRLELMSWWTEEEV